MKMSYKFTLLLIATCSSLCVQASSDIKNIASTSLQVLSGAIVYKTMEIHGEEMSLIERLHLNNSSKEIFKNYSLSTAKKAVKHATCSVACAQLAMHGEDVRSLPLSVGFIGLATIGCHDNYQRLQRLKQFVDHHIKE